MKLLLQKGIQMVKTPPETEAELVRLGEAAARASNKDFSPEFQKKVEDVLLPMRKRSP
jgi:hypothetical protein